MKHRINSVAQAYFDLSNSNPIAVSANILLIIMNPEDTFFISYKREGSKFWCAEYMIIRIVIRVKILICKSNGARHSCKDNIK